MIIEKSLIQVKCLTSKMAKQIQVMSQYNRPVDWKRLMNAFQGLKKTDEKQPNLPIGWTLGKNLGDNVPQLSKMWLVEFENNLWWVVAPYGGEPDAEGANEWYKNCFPLTQLFIS